MFENRIALSVKEAAVATGYDPRNIRKAIYEKRLRASRPGGKGDWRILPDDLRAWVRGEPTESAA